MKPKKKRILFADSDKKLLAGFKNRADEYIVETAHDGNECLKKLENFQPDLLICDLFLPFIHGIEILHKVKTDPRLHHIGVILTSADLMIQNYHSAINQNVDYVLEKPYELPRLFSLIGQFFEGKLNPAPFKEKKHPAKKIYSPKWHHSDHYIKFWGTRGSNPVSGADYMRFGGNTCCLEIRHGDDLLIIDAGTGIRPLGEIIEKSKVKNIHIIISHTHWDHLSGFPFFTPIYNSGSHVHIYTPIGFDKTAREIFTELLAYDYFPVRLTDMKATLTFKEIHEGEEFDIGPFQINTHYAYHPGATLCFKIKTPQKTFGYVTDNELLMGYLGNPNLIGKTNHRLKPYLSQIQFFKGCDLLVHEAQYTPKEYTKRIGWGHSSISNASVLIKHCEAPEWIITHHDPKHTDLDLFKKAQMQLDIIDDCRIDCHARMAYDGLTIPL